MMASSLTFLEQRKNLREEESTSCAAKTQETLRLFQEQGYQVEKIFIRHVLTHAEYNQNDWKKDSWYE